MNIVLTVIRFLCLMVSNFGYYNLLRKKTNLDVCFIPLVTISIQFLVLFFAGLLNLLLITAVAMLAMGVILFIIDICHHKMSEYRNFGTAAYLYLGICMVILAFCLRESKFFEFDDFSHWARVVQEMLAENCYPNFKSLFILFPTYPLGSSTYIYYCCLLTGAEENTMMLIQAFMLVCAIMPLFSCFQGHNLCGCIFMLLFTNFMMMYMLPVASLMVDTLLPLFAVGSFLIIWNICTKEERFSPKHKKSDIWIAAPLLTMILMIKDSGAFFSIPSFVAVAIMWKKHPEKKIGCGLGLFVPAVCVLFWKTHCKYMFPDVIHNKHSVSIERYGEEFRAKSQDFIIDTGYKILEFLRTYPGIWCMIALLLLVICVHCIFSKKHVRISLQFSGTVLAMYLLYIAGLYGMYIFSMPSEESIILAEISRYMSSADIAAFYIIFAYALWSLREFPFHKAFAAVLIVLVVLWGYFEDWQVVRGNYETPQRQWIEAQVQKYNIPLGAPCVICNNADNADGYLSNILNYLIWSPHVFREDDFDEQNLDKMKGCSYLLMVDYDSEIINQWILDQYPKQYGNSVIILHPDSEQ